MSNLWAQFQRIAPRTPIYIGTVIAHNSDGTSIVQLIPSNSLLRANGHGVEVGARAWVRGGDVESAAPNGSVSVVEI